MVTKKTTRKKKPSAKADSSETLRHALAEAALSVAAAEGWQAVNVERLASDTGTPLGQVIEICPTRSRIASLALQRVDQTVLAQVRRIDHNESPRDRLFEILMARFDVLQSSRDGYAALISYAMGHPAAAVGRVPATLHAMALMLIAAGLKADGPFGIVRVHALAVAYASVVRVWLKDDSADMAQTMSAMDKALGRLENLATMTAGKRPKKKTSDSDSPASSD